MANDDLWTVSKTQKQRVLMYLLNFQSITPLDALREFGIMRLAAVIFELRKFHEIETVIEKSSNRFGEEVRFARYKYMGKKKDITEGDK